MTYRLKDKIVRKMFLNFYLISKKYKEEIDYVMYLKVHRRTNPNNDIRIVSTKKYKEKRENEEKA